MDNLLTEKQKQYIKRNFDVKSPADIATHLKIDAEIVHDFIINELTFLAEPEEIQGLDLLEGLGLLQTQKNIPYSINFQLTDTGNVDISMEWSNNATTEEFIENVGVLLHMIHNGKMKSMIGQNLTKIAHEDDMEKEVIGAIRKWKELDKSEDSAPCINPYEVF